MIDGDQVHRQPALALAAANAPEQIVATDAGRVEDARDMATDLIADTLGSVGNVLTLIGWSLAGFQLTRRPGAELADDKLSSFFAQRLQ